MTTTKLMKKMSFMLLWLSFSMTLLAQQKKLSMEDAIMAYQHGLYPEQMYPVWRADSKTFTNFDFYNGDLKAISAQTANSEVLLNLTELNASLKTANLVELRMLYGYEWLPNGNLAITDNNQFIEYNPIAKSLVYTHVFDPKAENITRSVTGNFAYTIDNRLYVLTKEGKQYSVSGDNVPDGIVYGQTVSRNEFGISGGIFWSPDGAKLAFYRKDETKVAQYPLVDVSTRIATPKNIRYPMAGMASEEITVGIFDMASATQIVLNTTGTPEQYLTNLAWTNTADALLIAVLNREQNHMELKKYNATTGAFVAKLFDETDAKFVEPLHPTVMLKKTNQFIWQSQRDGYNHLYLYDANGKLIRQLTKGPWVVTDYLGTDALEKFAYVNTTINDPRERHLVQVEIKTGKCKTISTQAGLHNYLPAPDKSVFIDTYSNLTTPNVVQLIDTKGKVLHEVLRAANPLANYAMPTIEMFSIKAADSKTDLYGSVVKPADFDPTKKYPLIVYVYGGPHVQLVQNEWLGGTMLWQAYMAQHGYVSLTIDNRGSYNRGRDFENIVHRNLGVAEMADQVKALEWIKAQGFIDTTRVGVHGWSFGGFMTTSLLTTYPKLFQVGVAGGPVIDWKYYEVMYGERYMDTPEENPEGYAATSTLNKAKNLKGKLLLIHGDIDPVVVWQNSLNFVRECVKAGVQVDYFVYPQHEHNVRGTDRVHLMQKVSNYFDDYLK